MIAWQFWVTVWLVMTVLDLVNDFLPDSHVDFRRLNRTCFMWYRNMAIIAAAVSFLVERLS